MKTPIAVTLIIMGAALIITPVIADYFYQQHVVALMSRPGITSANLDGKMSDIYRLGCWLTGTAMVCVAIFSSLLRRKTSEDLRG